MGPAVGTVALLIFEPHRWFEVPNPLIDKYVRVPQGTLTNLAVAVGFEPTVSFHPHTLSRRAPLAARTRHRRKAYKHEAGRTESVRPAYVLARRIGDLNP